MANNETRDQIMKAMKHMPKQMNGEEMSAFMATVMHAYGLKAEYIWPMAYEAWRVLKELEVPNDEHVH